MTTPDYSESWIDPIMDGVVSEFQRSGYFQSVNGYEPKSSPSLNGLTAAVWAQRIIPAPLGSGLNSTTGIVLFFGRIYTNMISDPEDMIDPNMLKAASNMLRRFSADFTMDGLIKNVDLLGAHGVPLSVEFGYVQVNTTLYRAATIAIPCVVNDIWPQAE